MESWVDAAKCRLHSTSAMEEIITGTAPDLSLYRVLILPSKGCEVHNDLVIVVEALVTSGLLNFVSCS